MFVAARSNGSVDVWEFAVERKAGAELRDRIHRELHARRLRRPPLPFVEQLVGPIEDLDPPDAASNGHTSGGDDRFTLLRPRVVLVVVAIIAVIAAEVLIAISLLA
jgi:hypothetical protein